MAIDIETIRPKRDNRTELIKAQTGRDRNKVNACPFDKDFRHLDENGYCRHLIGTSENKKTYEPMHRNPKDGRRQTKLRTEEVEEMVFFDDGTGKPKYEKVLRPIQEVLPKGAVLVPISTSYRVYFDIDKQNRKPDLKLMALNEIPKEVEKMLGEVAIEQNIVIDKGVQTMGGPEKPFIVA